MNLNQVTVAVTNITQSITFYQTLGLRLIVHTNDNYARFECPGGDATFSLHKVDQMQRGGTWTYFEVPNVDRKVAELAAAGIKVDEMPEDKSWLWRESRVTDLDGNQIIIYHAGENRKNPPWRMGEPKKPTL
jgi:catechol 2,3-dioxygenase-like lactoylglutathione lyase family enzyme